MVTGHCSSGDAQDLQSRRPPSCKSALEELRAAGGTGSHRGNRRSHFCLYLGALILTEAFAFLGRVKPVSAVSHSLWALCLRMGCSRPGCFARPTLQKDLRRVIKKKRLERGLPEAVRAPQDRPVESAPCGPILSWGRRPSQALPECAPQ